MPYVILALDEARLLQLVRNNSVFDPEGRLMRSVLDNGEDVISIPVKSSLVFNDEVYWHMSMSECAEIVAELTPETLAKILGFKFGKRLKRNKARLLKIHPWKLDKTFSAHMKCAVHATTVTVDLPTFLARLVAKARKIMGEAEELASKSQEANLHQDLAILATSLEHIEGQLYQVRDEAWLASCTLYDPFPARIAELVAAMEERFKAVKEAYCAENTARQLRQVEDFAAAHSYLMGELNRPVLG